MIQESSTPSLKIIPIPYGISIVFERYIESDYYKKYNIQSKRKRKDIPQMQRHNDPYIMDDVLLTTLSKGNLQRINDCRLFLDTFLSDIFSIYEDTLISCFF